MNVGAPRILWGAQRWLGIIAEKCKKKSLFFVAGTKTLHKIHFLLTDKTSTTEILHFGDGGAEPCHSANFQLYEGLPISD